MDCYAALIKFFDHQLGADRERSVSGENYTRMLYSLACSVVSPVNTILEIGAGPWGGSGVTFAHALRASGYESPRLFSIEINPDYPPFLLVSDVRAELGVDWQIIRGDSLKVSIDPFVFCGVDLLYIDGDHGGEHVIGDYRLFSPLVRAGGLIVFDDFPIAGGVVAVVDVLTAEGVHGVALTYNTQDGNSHYVIRKK